MPVPQYDDLIAWVDRRISNQEYTREQCRLFSNPFDERDLQNLLAIKKVLKGISEKTYQQLIVDAILVAISRDMALAVVDLIESAKEFEKDVYEILP